MGHLIKQIVGCMVACSVALHGITLANTHALGPSRESAPEARQHAPSEWRRIQARRWISFLAPPGVEPRGPYVDADGEEYWGRDVRVYLGYWWGKREPRLNLKNPNRALSMHRSYQHRTRRIGGRRAEIFSVRLPLRNDQEIPELPYYIGAFFDDVALPEGGRGGVTVNVAVQSRADLGKAWRIINSVRFH